jgi:hypothetical protein
MIDIKEWKTHLDAALLKLNVRISQIKIDRSLTPGKKREAIRKAKNDFRQVWLELEVDYYSKCRPLLKYLITELLFVELCAKNYRKDFSLISPEDATRIRKCFEMEDYKINLDFTYAEALAVFNSHDKNIQPGDDPSFHEPNLNLN